MKQLIALVIIVLLCKTTCMFGQTDTPINKKYLVAGYEIKKAQYDSLKDKNSLQGNLNNTIIVKINPAKYSKQQINLTENLQGQYNYHLPLQQSYYSPAVYTGPASAQNIVMGTLGNILLSVIASQTRHDYKPRQ